MRRLLRDRPNTWAPVAQPGFAPAAGIDTNRHVRPHAGPSEGCDPFDLIRSANYLSWSARLFDADVTWCTAG